ncbi:phenylalanine--tRNA ligase subunit beta [[Acholeplasma] multilocale]|uniref:phenylalanine--tRNA ligase subunit beta n=1 Tax=[Acholeplasma] multilocale TaxID=264638 RepID=UPI00047B6933|nr:phenylalanine--tRNA ligase subunit beta [[Acholeplasma] multilocale]
MIITRKWLEKFINLSEVSNDQISVALNSLGFEVEETHDFSKLNDELIIGYVEESTPVEGTHLRLNKVNVGEKELAQIICGAPNVDKGQFVIVAQVGKTIANGLTLTDREIRGYKSQGMICALDEIGVSKNVLTELDQDSIYVINSREDLTSKIGKSISEINFEDYIWDMDLTLNRSDALAATQLLKEIANYFKLTINNDAFEVEVAKNSNKTVNITVDSDLKEEVRTISVANLELNENEIKVEAKDDLWLKFSQAKSVENPYEDLANMAAIISGQPVILIDGDKIGNELKISRVTIEEESFVALVDKGRIINVIGKKVEEEFKVTSDTKNVVAIYLNFNPVAMRKQQKALNMSSVDLQRYMKPLNPNLGVYGHKVLLAILNEYGIVKTTSEVNVLLKTITNVTEYKITLTKIKELLGIEISVEEIKSLFNSLDFSIEVEQDNLTFNVDENRMDLYGQNDICEEVARLYGYDNIQEQPPVIMARRNSKNINQKLQTKIGEYLIGKGFYNTKTYSLVDVKDVEKWNLFNIENPISLMSPLSKLHETYRTSLINSLIDVAIYNSSIDNKNVKLWEVADVYAHGEFRERHLAFLTTGDILDDKLNKTKVEGNYFYNKGIVEAILKQYNIDLNKVTFNNNENVIDEIHPFVNAEIKFEDKTLGFIFKLNPRFENIKKINPTFCVELNINALEEVSQKTYFAKEFSKFQQSTRDISLLISVEDKYQDLIKAMVIDVENIVNVKLIDEYHDETLSANNQKSLSISFAFNNLDHQLTEAEINAEWAKILDNVAKFGAIVR